MGDSFLQSGLESMIGWLITGKKRRRFARHALQTVTRRGEYSTSNMEKDLIHRRKPLKNLRNTKIASLTKMPVQQLHREMLQNVRLLPR